MSEEFYILDTESFAESANITKKLAENLDGAIENVDVAVNQLFDVWAGKGRNEFEKKYKIFERQVADIRTGLWDLYEDIISSEEEYIQVDVDLAKTKAGRDSRFGGR